MGILIVNQQLPRFFLEAPSKLSVHQSKLSGQVSDRGSFAMKSTSTCVTPPGSRSDPIGGSEQKSGARDYLYYILYTGTLIDMFFLRAVPVPMGIQTISVITKIILHIQKNYHRSSIHHNLYTYTESHLLIPVHFLLNIFCSSGIQNIIMLLHWSLHLIQTVIHIHT